MASTSRRAIRFNDPEDAFQKLKSTDDFSCFFVYQHIKNLISKDFPKIQQLLEQELASHPDFAKKWLEAKKKFQGRRNTMPQLPEECQIAIIAYTLDDPCNLYADFNEKCRKMLDENSWNSFYYKSVYALLARSMHQITNNPSASTTRLYRGLSHPVKDLNEGDFIFSKQILSCTPDKQKARDYMRGKRNTLICIEGSPVAACGIADLSVFPSEREVILFPWNIYKVVLLNRGQYEDSLYLEVVDSFVSDLPYSGDYKNKGFVPKNATHHKHDEL